MTKPNQDPAIARQHCQWCCPHSAIKTADVRRIETADVRRIETDEAMANQGAQHEERGVGEEEPVLRRSPGG